MGSGFPDLSGCGKQVAQAMKLHRGARHSGNRRFVAQQWSLLLVGGKLISSWKV